MPKVESVIPPAEVIALDVVDSAGVDVMQAVGSIGVPGFHIRRGNMVPVPTSLYTMAGATGPLSRPGNKKIVRAFIPGAAQTHTSMMPLGVPIGRDITLTPAALRTSRRYIWEVVFETSVQLAGVRRFVGFRDDATQIDAAGGGIGLSSISTENGGAWTLYYYLTNGGVLQVGASSGVVPVAGTPQAFQFIYRDSAAPQMLISIDGVLKFTINGLVNLPDLSGNEPHNPIIVVGSATNPGLGETDYQHESRFVIQELDPMPTLVGV